MSRRPIRWVYCKECKDMLSEKMAIKDKEDDGVYFCGEECQDNYELKRPEKKEEE